MIFQGNGGCCPTSIASAMPSLKTITVVSPAFPPRPTGAFDPRPYWTGTITETTSLVYPTVTVTEASVPSGIPDCVADEGCKTCSSAPTAAALTLTIDASAAALTATRTSSGTGSCAYSWTGTAGGIAMHGTIAYAAAGGVSGVDEPARFVLSARSADETLLFTRRLDCNGSGSSQMLGTYKPGPATTYSAAHTIAAVLA